MNIITRTEWGARLPRSRATTTWAQRTEFVVHYSEGPTSRTPRQIQNFHMDDRGWPDVGYNFLVDVKGRIYEGRGWLVVGAHAKGHNTTGVGVCFIGRDGDATDTAKTSIRALYDAACDKAGRQLLKRGHGQLSGNSTDCPGKQLLTWVKAGMPHLGGVMTAPPWPGRILKVADPMMHGPDVLAFQREMRRLRWTIAADTFYGPLTAETCRDFQRAHDLVVDGEVGPITWRAAFLTPAT